MLLLGDSLIVDGELMLCAKTMVKEGEEAARVTFYDGEGSTIQSL